MRQLWFVALLAALVPGSASAQNVTITWTRFVDPTENAFAFDVPQGWKVSGGIARVSATNYTPWLNAASADGTTQLFVGDPQIPILRVPAANQQEGQQLPPTGAEQPATVALRYRPGAEFAALYGPGYLGNSSCTDVSMTGQQAMPDVAARSFARAKQLTSGVVAGYVPPQHDAGLATFTCQLGGKPMVAGVIGDTAQPATVYQQWSAFVSGYLATPDQASLALGILNHVLASQQWNPQWDQAEQQATILTIARQWQENEQFEQQLAAASWQFTEQLLAQGAQAQAQRTAAHNAFMAQMQAQSAQENAQFVQMERQKGLNTWRFDAYIRNGQLYRDPKTGQYYEIDAPQ
jgi:hypothetical protein